MPRLISYIGIDPGSATGGIVVIDRYPDKIYRLAISKSTEGDIETFFRALYPEREYFAVIEKVNAYPGQGIASAFNFGVGYGFLRGMLSAMRIPYQAVTPKKWQPHYVSSGSKDKDHKKNLRAAAQRLFPEEQISLEIADAYLIAHYAKTVLWKEL